MKPKRMIYHVGAYCGFYSEFNSMVLAILYCRRHGINFKIYSKDAIFSINDGWNDYFLPFCKESHFPLHHRINLRGRKPTGRKNRLLLQIYKTLFPKTALTFELWDTFRNIDHTELSTEETRQQSGRIIDEIYRFNPQTTQRIEQMIDSLDMHGPYIGFHIRGGDKKFEHDLLSIDKYISQAEELSNIRQGVISTDDYRNFEALCKQYPNWKFYTLTPQTNQGYYQDQFTKLTPQQRYEELLIMFASMELLSRSELTICTFSSNIGMFLGMRIGDRAIGIDMDNWMIW